MGCNWYVSQKNKVEVLVVVHLATQILHTIMKHKEKVGDLRRNGRERRRVYYELGNAIKFMSKAHEVIYMLINAKADGRACEGHQCE